MNMNKKSLNLSLKMRKNKRSYNSLNKSLPWREIIIKTSENALSNLKKN